MTPRLDHPSAPPEPTRLPSPEERKVREVFERYGRDDAPPAAARAFAEANPLFVAALGITVDELDALVARNTRSITLEEALAHGLFEPIENDPLARLRRA